MGWRSGWVIHDQNFKRLFWNIWCSIDLSDLILLALILRSRRQSRWSSMKILKMMLEIILLKWENTKLSVHFGSNFGYSYEIYYYSRVHKSSDSFFSKILEKPSIVQKKMIPHINGLGFSLIWSKKKFKMADLENSKWPPQKNLIFQLRQFSIFFHEIFMDWSLG